MEKLLKLLQNREYKITNKHYGNSATKKLKIIYVVGHIFDHVEFNKLGYGIVSVSSLDDLK